MAVAHTCVLVPPRAGGINGLRDWAAFGIGGCRRVGRQGGGAAGVRSELHFGQVLNPFCAAFPVQKTKVNVGTGRLWHPWKGLSSAPCVGPGEPVPGLGWPNGAGGEREPTTGRVETADTPEFRGSNCL